MPKRVQDYDSDGGFVEDAPKSKKSKSGANQQKTKEGKAVVSTQMHKDDEGNEYWEISRTRRVQISTFKASTMVGIREFYEKDGKMLPGKKGISLSIDQFTAVLDVLPQIEVALESRGISVPRPKYGKNGPVDVADEEEEEEEEEEDDDDDDDADEEADEDEKPKKRSRLDKFNLKANHEATSDEDDE